jgi:hypothetical protein
MRPQPAGEEKFDGRRLRLREMPLRKWRFCFAVRTATALAVLQTKFKYNPRNNRKNHEKARTVQVRRFRGSFAI